MSKTRKGAGKRRSIFWRFVWILVKLASLLALIVVLSGSIAAFVMVRKYGKDLPNLDNLTKAQPVVTRVNDRNGIAMCEIGGEKRIMLKPGTLPKFVKNAAIAAEDKNFYKHGGWDWKAMSRAGLRYAKTRKFSQGGSTITQQVAKNYILTSEKKISRKVKEILIAEKIEKKYGKEEILELYFNKVNYGFGRYGIETASRFYFGKTASELTLAEAALLVGLHPRPEGYSPRKNMKLALQRRAYVLKRMLAEKMITQAEFDAASKEVPQIVSDRPVEARVAQETCDKIRKDLEKQFKPEEIDFLGLIYQSTIDLKLNAVVKQLQAEGVARIAKRHNRPLERAPESAVVVIELATNSIIAMSGGVHYKAGGLNRALDAKLQPGSTFKLFGYTAGFAAGAFTPVTIFENSKITYEDNGRAWSPGNYEGEAENEPTKSVRDAFAHSFNTVAVKAICGLNISKDIVQPVPIARCKSEGIIDQTIEMAGKLGVQMSDKAKRERNPSLILGTEEVTPIQLLNAYATFGRGGKWVEPTIVTRILGEKAPALPPPESHMAVEGQALGFSRLLLRSVIAEGTGRRAEGKFPEDAYGKTGTTSDNSDAWFVGFTRSYAVIVWVGYDSRATKLGRGETGASAALPIWIDVMRAAYGMESAAVKAMRQKPVEDEAAAVEILAEPLAKPTQAVAEPVAELTAESQTEEAEKPAPEAVDVDEELAKAAARILREDNLNAPAE